MATSVKSNLALSLSYIRDPAAKVRELCNHASQVEAEPAVPARRYLRSGLEMLRMAKVYKDEGEYESAFILYMKFITLFVEKLPRHPGYKEAPQNEVANIRQKVKQVFPVAEELKGKLTVKYTEQEKQRAEEERKKAEEIAREQEKIRAEEERQRKEEEERSRKLREQSEELWLQEQEEKFRQLQEREKEKQKDKDRRDPNILIDDTGENRPSSGLNNERGSVPSGSLSFVPNDLRQGQRPKLEKNLSQDYTPNIPDRPEIDRSTKPPQDQFGITDGFGENKYGLKNVLVPRDIVTKFMNIAEQNTRRNVETCGILSGKMDHGVFFITHVLVPKQTGTSDSCNAENEEDLFEFQDSNDLLSLGWIHTHPTQTAFLSSVDLHTHYPYQQLMPEAVAIVVSPKFNETGVFMLTPDRGLPEVARCSKRGHHEHTKHPPVFETCSHARFVDDRNVILVDLRSK
ncbi:STAM-binding protein-like [Mercenaria mercenaria]|uniref:STAM-binding protein-like n=1 Tax=Mercenaria mercenaria TaxID=6596 RepID=UPI001E1D9824|nr:STAM-binding protein-like [Mercenaria mercenaria]XP_045214574.1 STAM-binding protein-like [Mercenaria mercenaria]XP_045214575.1 STAM-binding protein-like [Mercenaria mercenaria]